MDMEQRILTNGVPAVETFSVAERRGLEFVAWLIEQNRLSDDRRPDAAPLCSSCRDCRDCGGTGLVGDGYPCPSCANRNA